MLRLAGVFPGDAECASCGRDLAPGAVLPPAAEGLVCRRCARGEGLDLAGEVVELLRRSAHENLESLAARPPGRTTLEAAAELSARVRRGFLQHELKSFRVIRETLDGLPPDASVG